MSNSYMKILFLDFDGCLNPLMFFSSTGKFSKPACNNLNHVLIKVPDLRIVVSSGWRAKGLEYVREVLKDNGIDPIKVIDITEGPKEREGQKTVRDHHIVHWLNEHPEITDFVIIDDEAELPDFKHKYVKPNPYVGFTLKDAEQVLKILGK